MWLLFLMFASAAAICSDQETCQSECLEGTIESCETGCNDYEDAESCSQLKFHHMTLCHNENQNSCIKACELGEPSSCALACLEGDQPSCIKDCELGEPSSCHAACLGGDPQSCAESCELGSNEGGFEEDCIPACTDHQHGPSCVKVCAVDVERCPLACDLTGDLESCAKACRLGYDYEYCIDTCDKLETQYKSNCGC